MVVSSEKKNKLNLKNLKTTPSCVSKHKQHNGRSSQIYLMVRKSHSLQTHQTIENDAICMKIKLQCQKNESNRLYLILVHSSKNKLIMSTNWWQWERKFDIHSCCQHKFINDFVIDWINVDTMKHKQTYLHHNKNDE